MKKVLQLIVWLIVMLLIVIIIKTLLFTSLQTKSESVAMVSPGDECIDHLSKAVRFQTISYSGDSPVDSSSFRNYISFIAESYPLTNSRLKKEVFNKFSLLYTWQGKNPSLKPVIFLAHSDVVPPGDSLSWEKKPFSGENDGNFIWGRGTLDDKSEMISILEAVEKLLSEGYEPERTVYLSFGHDEEIGGTRGAAIIAQTLRDRGVEAEFVLDEGMVITTGIVPMVKKPVALIGTSEKGYISVKLAAEMAGGHSSTPEKESALIVLNTAIFNLVHKQMKAKISEPVNDFIRYIGPEMPFYAKAIFANKWLMKGILLSIYQGTGSGNALVRTTTAPTIISAGIKDNIIPTRAEAVVNFRILPGETSADILAHIERVVNDKRVNITPFTNDISEPVPASPSDAPAFLNLFSTLREIYPEVVIAPTMMLGSSDSKHFTILTKNIYRFAPLRINSMDLSRMHGLNEKVKIEDYRKGIGFYYQLIKNSQLLKLKK
jgi:carboxypeptidase PM20D1